MQSTETEREHDACGVGFIYRPVKTHRVIKDALEALCKIEHRGALGADDESGDGAGILAEIPWAILEKENLPVSQIRAVGVVFLPAENQDSCRQAATDFLENRNFNVLGWRKVPVRPEVLGPDARKTCPEIEFVLLAPRDDLSEIEFEKKLVVTRKLLINSLAKLPFAQGFYIASMSSRSIVYKAMTKSVVLAKFYLDLQDESYVSNWAVFHRRFSTNTNPNWRLAQPFRMLGHNGEINTLSGNRNWLHAREMIMDNPLFTDRRDVLRPMVHPLGSDSANLDNLFELFVLSGLSPQEAMMRLIPEAHSELHTDADPHLTAFYNYHAALQEPWDGPALIVFSDGKTVGASLDRNGLRPARYTVLKDGSVILCSETGVLDLDISEIAEKGRLGPGQMLAVDLSNGEIQHDFDIKKAVSRLHPYTDWLSDERTKLDPQFAYTPPSFSQDELLAQQIAAGYGEEDLEQIIGVMADTGHEPVFSMGDDAALAVLSKHPRSMFDYFRQKFAQVTNPPIDHLRERLVFSLDCFLGKKSTVLTPARESAHLLALSSPVLTEANLAQIESLTSLPSARVSPLLDKVTGSLTETLDRICQEAAAAVERGCQIIILSDRPGSSKTLAAPAVLAVGAVHNYLTENSLRMNCSLVVETAQTWSTHQFACLLGFGAEAICPYLAFETIRQRLKKTDGGTGGDLHTAAELEERLENFRTAINSGLLKVLSKMGISALSSYTGAQIFECIGIGQEIIKQCFPGIQSHLHALTFSEVEEELKRFHDHAYHQNTAQLKNRGHMRHRKDGEYHGNNPALVSTLHKALGYRNSQSSAEERLNEFLNYASLSRKHEPGAVRDLLTFVSDREPIALAEVESVENIVKRFCTGGMSLGALSPESHTVLAVAMNRLGAKSNSGEGGEDPLRYRSNIQVNSDGSADGFPGIRGLKTGDSAASAIRQVASARFGVTPEYLVTAKQLEIKMAQGAKPGEGGQLPGAKVSSYIAKLRCADEGTTLISPPTHHDIYSIEDLAQLIFDLKQVNPKAAISVKLVAEAGIGTIAAGVAKAKADIIQISGHDGGTGASPLSSIKHAGIPWELGLAEVQRVLFSTRLRKRVLLRVDGGLRSAWDILIAAMLGAEEFGFGSIALVAQGCIMARVCHTNNCPVGITSQKEALRKKFPGVPEKIVEFFLFLAEDVRYMLAGLGYKTLAELVGRADLLTARPGVELPKTSQLDLSALLGAVPPAIAPLNSDGKQNDDASQQNGSVGNLWTEIKATKEKTLTERILAEPEVLNALRGHARVERSYEIRNTDRAVGARIAGEIASVHGEHGFRGNVTLAFHGAAGQSFGAFLVENMQLSLTGEANDYVGKGMNGGEIVVRPYEGFGWDVQRNIIIGNACLYGATGGTLFAAGQAGERFAVRNSRANAVIEGTGDHCCEYMTGGTVVVLGRVGRNFGAGMTGGTAFVYDDAVAFPGLCNIDSGMAIQRVDESNAGELRQLIERHLQLTGSQTAKAILENWSESISKFWQVSRNSECTITMLESQTKEETVAESVIANHQTESALH